MRLSDYLLKGIAMMVASSVMPGEDMDSGPSEAMKRIGQRIRLARQLAGYERREDFVRELERKAGLAMKPSRLGFIERGEYRATFMDLVAIVVTAEPPGGIDFFLPPMSEDERSAWDRSKTKKL